ncbi:alpha/beta hydrolase [Nocardia sp. NPDC005978]|uniref:alpha/beta hydrolase n=1 Tax=Nocardia sp. NPDC005978 TaxID=3156725 RepID=UPI0033A78136
MPFFDGPRGRLHHRHWPAPDAVASVALLPGIGQHSGHYHRFARVLNAAHIDLWTLDTAGHGLSEGDARHPGTLPELSRDAQTFLAQIPPTPLVLMGHSLGAATALALIGACPALVPPAATPPPVSALILCGTPKTILRGAPPVSTRTAPGDRTAPSAGNRGAQSARSTPAAADPRAAHVAPAGPGPEPQLPGTLPTLVVHGTDDRRAPVDVVRAWVRHQPRADYREYRDAGHDLLHEPVHTEVASDIVTWIEELAR